MPRAALGFLGCCTSPSCSGFAWCSGPDMISSPSLQLAHRSASAIFLTNMDWALMTYAAIVGSEPRARVSPRVAGARAERAAAGDAALRRPAEDAAGGAPSALPVQHAARHLDAVHTKPELADRMISRLSDLLRLTFDQSGASRVPLQEELEFLQKYLDIEQTRFQDRLTVRFEIDPDTLDAEVPRLILQPLVENAIQHGIAPRSGPGHVQIASASRRSAASGSKSATTASA